MRLLTYKNAKTPKGQARGYDTYILYLAPSDVSGYNTCPMASEGCRAACLFTAGRGRFRKTFEARVRKTILYFEARDTFLAWLKADIEAAIRRSKRRGMEPVFRLNGTSDIRWERHGIIQAFPSVQFYDYTKIPNRQNLPANYHLTFSLSEDNDDLAVRSGMNVAVVFGGEMPDTFLGLPVVSGDDDDVRFKDPVGCVVGLTAKGDAKGDDSGFVRRVS